MNNDMYDYVSTELLRYYYSGPGKKFIFPQDTYENWMMLISEEGDFQVSLGEEWEDVQRGEVVLCPPQITLYRRSTSYLSFHFFEFIWYDPAGHPYQGAGPLPHGRLPVLNAGRLASTLQLLALYNNTSDRPPSAAYYQNHLMNDILHLCLKEAYDLKFGSANVDPLIKQATEYIRRNAGMDISMGALAEEIGLSQSQFTRRFQAAWGISPIAFLTRYRINMIKTFLLETEMNLEQIAERSGYQNGFYLSRVFRKKTGMSPSEFRRTHRF